MRLGFTDCLLPLLGARDFAEQLLDAALGPLLVDGSNHGQAGPVGAVVTLVVGAHLGGGEALELLAIPDDRVVIGMGLIEQRLGRLVQRAPRLILAHRQLLKHDVLLARELDRIQQAPAHAAGFNLQRGLPSVGSHREVVGGAVGIREGVVAAAHLARLDIDLAFTELLRPLEHHVLQEVRQAGLAGVLIARAHLIPENRRDHGQRAALHEQRTESVVELEDIDIRQHLDFRLLHQRLFVLVPGLRTGLRAWRPVERGAAFTPDFG